MPSAIAFSCPDCRRPITKFRRYQKGDIIRLRGPCTYCHTTVEVTFTPQPPPPIRPPGPSYEKRGRFWAVYLGDELVAVVVYKKGAISVIEHLTKGVPLAQLQ